MKLNLGCGTRKRPGWWNVDHDAACAPDQVVDLERLPWPFTESDAEAIVMEHVLEHLGQRPADFLAILRELYRVSAPGAEIEIRVPHPRHRDFLADPTHVRPILPETLELFDQAKNRQWALEGGANTPLGLQCSVDFEILEATYLLDPMWEADRQAGLLSEDDLERAVRTHLDVVKEIFLRLRVHKPGRG